MHNPAPVLENYTHKLLWEFDVETDHLISARRPDLIIINKKKIVDFAIPADYRIMLNTQHYKVWIKGKVEQSKRRSNAHPNGTTSELQPVEITSKGTRVSCMYY